MKENFFKTYFKTFGVFTFLLFVALFVGIGLLGYSYPTFVGPTVSAILKGVLLVLFPCLAVIGLSKLKSEKVGLLDFLRVVAFVSSIVLLVMGAVSKNLDGLGYGLYICSAVVFFIEVIFRAKFADDQSGDASFKNYFGALAGTYNPLLILIIAVALAVVASVLLKNGYVGQAFGTFTKNQFVIFGIAVGGLAMMLIPALDRNAEVTLLDLFVASLFVASVYLTFVAITFVSKKELMAIMIVVVATAGILLLRAVSYNKGKGYDNPAHKVRTYFKQTYETFDPAFALTVGGFFVLFFGLAYACAIRKNPISVRFGMNGNGVMAYSIFAIAVAVILLFLIIIFRKLKSTKIEKVDWVLIPLFFGSASVITTVIATAIADRFDLFTKNTMLMVALIVFGVVFFITCIVQIIRLRSFDPVYALVSDKPVANTEEEEQVTEEEQPEEEVVEEEPADPFALTEEDEEIYESVYGKDEEEAEEVVEEEQPEEEVVYEEAVEEEQPEEEAVYEEVVEEVPAEEEAVVEEEAPAEEEADEEEADEEEAEEEEEEDEADEYEDAEGDDEVFEELPITKESQVIVQDFQIVDEEGKPKKIKRRFNSKMMFAPYETKEYYNEIKNYLQMYRAKGRYSARCESYRYKGLVAKVALGGKSIKVFLAIDPSFIDENPKYHLKNVSEKKQYAEVPVMIKVRSARALKYFKELVDYMMANRLVKPKRNYTPVNYMPQLIPNGEAIMATLGMTTDYLHNSMNVHSIPADMPDDLADYIPMIPGEELDEEEVEANVYLDTLCNHFEDGDEITIDVLKTLHIVTKGNVLRIKARGTLDRKLIIYAEYFDADALKMLMCTNCTAIKIIR